MSINKNKTRRPVILAIFDGLGISSNTSGNAFKAASTPFLDHIFKDNLTLNLSASGTEVGLLKNTMGNSEVGHLTIGAGRVIQQPLTRITNEINRRKFANNKLLLQFLQNVNVGNKRLHIMGLASNGRVHADIKHLYALCKVVAKLPITVFLHLFLDGRDTRKNIALEDIKKLELFLNSEKISNITISTVSGRFYSMDRDLHLERTEQVLNVIYRTNNKGNSFTKASDYISKMYQNNIFDEFIEPAFSEQYTAKDAFQSNDHVICFNYRPDRVIQICSAITNPNYAAARIQKVPTVNLMSFVYYANTVKCVVLYPRKEISNTIGEVVANAGLGQLRVAETEKMAHVTYFLDGGIQRKLNNCDKILIPSNRAVATYDMCPAMSAEKITNNVIQQLLNYDLIIFNYANADMVGHTGNFAATKIAIELLDLQISRIYKAVKKVNGTLIITADHGNSEKMLYSDKTICKTHTENDVPLCITGSPKWSLVDSKKKYSLQDVAPTILNLLNISIPDDMSGSVLIKRY